MTAYREVAAKFFDIYCIFCGNRNVGLLEGDLAMYRCHDCNKILTFRELRKDKKQSKEMV